MDIFKQHAKIIDLATELFDDKDLALIWMRTNNPHFLFHTPRQILIKGYGVEVIDYLFDLNFENNYSGFEFLGDFRKSSFVQ